MPCHVSRATPRHALQLSIVFCLLGLASPLAAEGLVTGLLKRKTEQLKLQRVEADGRAITSALKIYKLNAGQYPTDKQGLKALVEKPTEAPFPKRWVRVMDKIPRDAWDREYRLVVRTKNDQPILVILSDGPDPEALTDDLEMPVEKPDPEPVREPKPDPKPEPEAK